MERRPAAVRVLVMIAFCVVLRSSMSFGCSLPLEARKTALVAKVTIGAAGPFRFLLDTGTSITVVSPAVADTLGLAFGENLDAMSTTGAVAVSRSTLWDVRAGQIALEALAVLIAPVPQVSSQGRIDGILGMNFLAGRSYLLDVTGRCLDVDVPSEDIAGGNRFKARQIVGRVAVEASDLVLVLDSAASLAVLASKRAGALAQRDGFTEVGSAAGRQRVPGALVPELRLGDMAIRNLPAVIMPKPDWAEDALLPVNIFSSIYVDAARSIVVLNGTRVDEIASTGR